MNEEPKFMNRVQLASYFGMSVRGVEEGIRQAIQNGHEITVIRPASARGHGHPRYKVADILKAWRYSHPLAM